MPIKYGQIIPERFYSRLLCHKMCVLFDIIVDEQAEKEIADVCTLRDYLNDLVDSPANLELICTSLVSKQVISEYQLTEIRLKDGEVSRDYFEEIAVSQDADIIMTSESRVNQINPSNLGKRLITCKFRELKSELEIFVRGHEIPWSFGDPCWFLPWEVFYTTSEEDGKTAQSLYTALYSESSTTVKAKETVKSLLLNRFANISYARDKLLFYVQQRTYTKRHGFRNQSYRFECSFLLTCYYLLLWGGTEQLSYLIDNVLEINFGWRGRNIANKRFLEKISQNDEGLSDFLKQDEILKWIKQLRRNRHHVAHQGNIILSDLMEVPDVEKSESDLEKAVEAHPSWSFIKRFQSEDAQQSFKSMIRQQIRIASYKKQSDSVMVIEEGSKQYMFSPLVNVQWDYNNFKLVTFGVLEHLLKKVSSH